METPSNSIAPKSQRNRFVLLALIVLIVLWLGINWFFPGTVPLFAGTRPDDLGVKSGRLTACAPTPNCVNSQATDAIHAIDPLSYDGISATDAIARLKSIIQSQPRTKIIAANDNYLYAEFTTPLMGFVDDVEFLADTAKPVIHVRSASRLGESDLGVNRQRIETLRQTFQTFNPS